MTSPWLLVVAGGATVGALFGMPGVVLWVTGVAIGSLPGGSRTWLVVLALVGATAGAVRVGLDAEPPLASSVMESQSAEVVVRSVPQSGPSGPRAVVRVERIAPERGEWQVASGNVLVLFRDNAPASLAQGDRLRLRWAVSDVDRSTFGRFVRSSGASASASAFDVNVLSRGESPLTVVTHLREVTTRRIVDAIPGDAGALLAGFVTGDDSGLSPATREAFDQTGMSHITAVSGSNVAVLLTIWFFLVPTGRMRRSLPAILGIMAVIWLYVLLVGMGPGAVRAGMFSTIVLPAARLGRVPDPLTALMLASAIMVLVQPDFAHSVGFWLSLAASTAMVMCVDRRANTRARLLASGAVALVAAQLATLPIIAWMVGGWSPASIVANLIVGPIVSVVFPVAFVLAIIVTVLPWLGDLAGWLPGIGADVIVAIVESIARQAGMLRLGARAVSSIALVAILSAAAIVLLSSETRRWFTRLLWRYPGLERHAVAVMLGTGLGVWLAVVARSVLG